VLFEQREEANGELDPSRESSGLYDPEDATPIEINDATEVSDLHTARRSESPHCVRVLCAPIIEISQHDS
jgi:hypothetical protein